MVKSSWHDIRYLLLGEVGGGGVHPFSQAQGLNVQANYRSVSFQGSKQTIQGLQSGGHKNELKSLETEKEMDSDLRKEAGPPNQEV